MAMVVLMSMVDLANGLKLKRNFQQKTPIKLPRMNKGEIITLDAGKIFGKDKIDLKKLPKISADLKGITIESSHPKLNFNYKGLFQNCDFFKSIKAQFLDTKNQFFSYAGFCDQTAIFMNENFVEISKVKLGTDEKKYTCTDFVMIGGVSKEEDPNVVGLLCQEKTQGGRNQQEELRLISIDLAKAEATKPEVAEKLNFHLKDAMSFPLLLSGDGESMDMAVGVYKSALDRSISAGESSFFVYLPQLQEGSRLVEVKKPETVDAFGITNILSVSSGIGLASANKMLLTAYYIKKGETQAKIGVFRVGLNPSTREVDTYVQIDGADGLVEVKAISDDALYIEDSGNKQIGLCLIDWASAQQFNLDNSTCGKVVNEGQENGLEPSGYSGCSINSCGVVFREKGSEQMSYLQTISFIDKTKDSSITQVAYQMQCFQIAANTIEALFYRSEGFINIFGEDSNFSITINSADLPQDQQEFTLNLSYSDLETETPLQRSLDFTLAQTIVDSPITTIPYTSFEAFLEEEQTLPIDNQLFKANALDLSISSTSSPIEADILEVNRITFDIASDGSKIKSVIPIGQGVITLIGSKWYYAYCSIKLSKTMNLKCNSKVELDVTDSATYVSSKRYDKVTLIHFVESSSSKSIIVVYDEFIKTKSKVEYKEVGDFISYLFFQGDKIYFGTKQQSASGYSKVMMQTSYSDPKLTTIYELKKDSISYNTLDARIENHGDTVLEVVAIVSNSTSGARQLQFKRINLNNNDDEKIIIDNYDYEIADNNLNRILLNSKTCVMDRSIIFYSTSDNKIVFSKTGSGDSSSYINTRTLDLGSLGVVADFNFYCFRDIGFFSFTALKKNSQGEDEVYLVTVSNNAVDQPDNYIKAFYKLPFAPENIAFSFTKNHLLFELKLKEQIELLSIEISGPRFYFNNNATESQEVIINAEFSDTIYQQEKRKFDLSVNFKKPKVKAEMRQVGKPKIEKKQFPIYSILNVTGPEGIYSLSNETKFMKVTHRLQKSEGDELKGKNGEAVSPKSLKMVRNGDIFGLVDNNLNTELYHWLDDNFKAINSLGAFCSKIQVETISITRYLFYLICSENQVRRPRIVDYDSKSDKIRTIIVVSELQNFDPEKLVFLRVNKDKVWLLLQNKEKKEMLRGIVDVSEISFREKYQGLQNATVLKSKLSLATLTHPRTEFRSCGQQFGRNKRRKEKPV